MISRRNLLRSATGTLIGAAFVAKSGVLMPVREIAGPEDITLEELDRIRAMFDTAPFEEAVRQEYLRQRQFARLLGVAG